MERLLQVSDFGTERDTDVITGLGPGTGLRAFRWAETAIVFQGAMNSLNPVHKISIVQRGFGALGYTMQLPLEDRYLMTRPELLDKITILRIKAARIMDAAKLANVNQSALSRKLRKPQAFVCPCCGAKRHHQGILQTALPRQHEIVDDLIDGVLG